MSINLKGTKPSVLSAGINGQQPIWVETGLNLKKNLATSCGNGWFVVNRDLLRRRLRNGAQAKVWASSLQERLNCSRLRKYSLVNYVGKPADQIVAVADENQADLIVMGHLSHAAWLRRLIGSTLDRMLRNTELPVLVA